ncbi:hypothetical protein [Cellulomonas sp. ICMP 17802]|uniref:hypothetical protein n=1 Tax=Cellulomonas sp. ICMP 17802 TaxID=3239199 RepID=UPI00351ABAA7
MIAALLLAAPAPSPSPTDVNIDGTPVGSPGFLGFVFTFLLAVALVFLFLSLTKQLRVVDRRAKKLGLDDDADDQADDPHADRGLVDAGAAGPDSEVDADVEVALRDYLADEPPADPTAPDRPGPETPRDPR